VGDPVGLEHRGLRCLRSLSRPRAGASRGRIRTNALYGEAAPESQSSQVALQSSYVPRPTLLPRGASLHICIQVWPYSRAHPFIATRVIRKKRYSTCGIVVTTSSGKGESSRLRWGMQKV